VVVSILAVWFTACGTGDKAIAPQVQSCLTSCRTHHPYVQICTTVDCIIISNSSVPGRPTRWWAGSCASPADASPPLGCEGRSNPGNYSRKAGNDFRAALEKGVRLKAPGQPITARLLEPVYAGEVLAIPAGSTIKGHISAISTPPMRKRARRLLNGDFTPPKTAHVTFDQLVLSDGTMVPIHGDSAVGLGRVTNSLYLPRRSVLESVKNSRALWLLCENLISCSGWVKPS